jgi:Zn-dependent protease with chaperone function
LAVLAGAMVAVWSDEAFVVRIAVVAAATVAAVGGIVLRSCRGRRGHHGGHRLQDMSTRVAHNFGVEPLPVEVVVRHPGIASLEGGWPRRSYVVLDESLMGDTELCEVVLAHEYGHFLHPRRRWRLVTPMAEVAPLSLVVFGFDPWPGMVVAFAASLAASAVLAARSQREELDADAAVMRALGPDAARALVRLFDGTAKGGFLASHPSDERRRQALRQVCHPTV